MSGAQRPGFLSVLEAFEALEQRLELPAWTVAGAPLWKRLRPEVFAHFQGMLAGEAVVRQPAVEGLRRGFWRAAVRLPYQLVVRNPFLRDPASVRRIVLPHRRKQPIDGQFADPITLRAWSGSRRCDSLVLDRVTLTDPHPLRGFPSDELLSRLTWLYGRQLRVVLSAADRRRMAELQQHLPASLPLERMVVQAVRFFHGQRRAYARLFRRYRPACFYLAISYGNEGAIAAAQDQRVAVAEFQHGALGRGHLGYDFRGWDDVPHFPDHLLAFGPDWFDDVRLPRQTRVVKLGAPHVEARAVDACAGRTRMDKSLLVISQGSVAGPLIDCIGEFLQVRTDWSVVIRPHPGEGAAAIRAGLKTRLGQVPEPVSIRDDESLLEQAAGSDVVLGVYSTGIVEAMMAGCRAVLLETPTGPPFFRRLAETGNAAVVRDGRELAAVIDEIPRGTARGYFAEPVDPVARVEEKLPT